MEGNSLIPQRISNISLKNDYDVCLLEKTFEIKSLRSDKFEDFTNENSTNFF